MSVCVNCEENKNQLSRVQEDLSKKETKWSAALTKLQEQLKKIEKENQSLHTENQKLKLKTVSSKVSHKQKIKKKLTEALFFYGF